MTDYEFDYLKKYFNFLYDNHRDPLEMRIVGCRLVAEMRKRIDDKRIQTDGISKSIPQTNNTSEEEG